MIMDRYLQPHLGNKSIGFLSDDTWKDLLVAEKRLLSVECLVVRATNKF